MANKKTNDKIDPKLNPELFGTNSAKPGMTLDAAFTIHPEYAKYPGYMQGTSNAKNRHRWANLYGQYVDTKAPFDFNNPNIQNRMKEKGLTKDSINTYNPDNYKSTISPKDLALQYEKKEDGGLLPNQYGLPEYGFGSWIKENGAGILKGAGTLASVIPAIGQIAGPVLGVAGSLLQSKQDKNTEATAEELALKEQATEQQDVNTNVYETGGSIGNGLMGKDPQIIDYSNGNTHQEGVGGIPVDARGNPSTTSNESAVGMTEKGEVTWNGYVFSDKLKTK